MSIIGPVKSIILELEKAPFDFHLTGSRFFGGALPNSDWDFFAENNDSIIVFLRELGFKVLTEGYKDDPQVAVVYRHNDGIDVQLTDHIVLKKDAQKYIYQSGVLRRRVSKHAARLVWQFVYHILVNHTGLIIE